MNIELLKSELKRDEGVVKRNGRHVAYKDHLGFWTIGIGRLIDKRRGGGLTDEEANYLLENDIGRCLVLLRERIPYFENLSDTHQRALVNMAFQLGPNGLLNFKKMLAAMEIGHFQRAALEALDSRWARQTPARAQRIANMIRNG